MALTASDAISEKEMAVLRLVASGLANKEVARQLGISTNTVRAHLGRIYLKTFTHNRTELALKFHGIQA